MSRTTARAVLLAAAALLSACFEYVPAELETLEPGGEVRVYLSRRGIAELPEEVPAGNRYLAGSFAGRGGDSLRVRVPIGAPQPGFLTGELREEVHVPTREIEQVERRQFSRVRTALLGAGGAGAAVAIVALIHGSITGAGDAGPGEDFLRVPLFSVIVH